MSRVLVLMYMATWLVGTQSMSIVLMLNLHTPEMEDFVACGRENRVGCFVAI